MAIVPCALCMLIVAADEAVERVGRALRRWRRRTFRWVGGKVLEGSLGRRWRLVRIAHALRAPAALEHSEPTCPPIQQVAADLRRLSRQRVGTAIRAALRLFVAAYPSREAVAHLSAQLTKLALGQPAEPGRSLRVIKPETWHVTLAFLGEVPDERLDAASSALLAVHLKKMHLRVAGGGRFGRGRFTT